MSDAPADIFLDNGFVRVEIDIPCIRPGVDVRTEGHTVTVEAHRHDHPGTCVRRERPAEIRRRVELPPEADMLNVHASTHDGVLMIVAPLGPGRAEPGERRLEVLPSTFACHPDAAPI